MAISLRPYTPDDWDAICRIHDAARPGELAGSVAAEAFLPLADTYENEGLFDGSVVVAELDDAVAGFVAWHPGEITWLYVDPALARRGVATALVKEVLDTAEGPVELEVLSANTAARAFYEHLGFVYSTSTTGKLAGNEEFQVTGHTLVWRPPAS